MMKNSGPFVLITLGMVLVALGSILSVKQQGNIGLLLLVLGAIVFMTTLVILLKKKSSRKKTSD